MGTQCKTRSVVSVRSLEERKTVTTATNSHTWIGKDIKRREDPDLLTGRAEYTSDVKLPGMLHAAVLRSPYAHARIVSIDTSAAKKLPAVRRPRCSIHCLPSVPSRSSSTQSLSTRCAMPEKQWLQWLPKVAISPRMPWN